MSYSNQTSGYHQPPPPPMSNVNPLPPGWEMRMDHRTGWPYFINHADKSTTWQDPRLLENQNQFQQQNQSPQQYKQPRRIPVPVHHEPSLQQQHQYQSQFQPQQMPIPQQTGDTYQNQCINVAQPSNGTQQQRVRNPIPILVRHVPEVAPGKLPEYSRVEKVIPISIEKALGREVPDDVDMKVDANEADEMMQDLGPQKEVEKRPIARKQTSLVVSDDHTTPIPMPYDSVKAETTVLDEDGNQQEQEIRTKQKHPVVRKQTSLVVSDDHTTPIPMPYERLDMGDRIVEEEEPNVEEDVGEPPKDLPWHCEERKGSGPPVKVIPITRRDRQSSSVGRSTEMLEDEPLFVSQERPATPKPREVPVTIKTNARPAQGASRIAQSQPKPTISRGAVDAAGMPQPHPTGSTFAAHVVQPNDSFAEPNDNYAQPKPPAPKRKQEWVDPRITQALDAIEKVFAEAKQLGSHVDALQVVSKDRAYMKIEEQLTKLLLKLDSIDALGDDGVRSKRKACIRQVQQTLDALELKLLSS